MTTTKEKAPLAGEAQSKTLDDDIKLCSGFGQYHTNEADTENPNKRLVPYAAITLSEIEAMAENPQAVDKAKGQWFIPSSLASRSSAAQEANGKYWALWCDFDKNPPPISELAAYWAKVSGAKAIHYSSRSATESTPKSRLIVPLAYPLDADDWTLAAECLNDLFEQSGYTPDRVSERIVQLCYLPNKGAFYEWHKHEGKLFDPLTFFADAIQVKRQAIEQELIEAEERRKVAEINRANFKASESTSAVDAFNALHTIEDVLLKAGYSRKGARFRHPQSESGGYSVSIKNGRAYSHSTSDPLHTTAGAHDAFSAWAVLFFGNDQSEAAKVVYAQMRRDA